MNLRIKVIVVLALVIVAVAGAVGIYTWVVVPADAIDAAAKSIEWARSAQADRYAPELFNEALSDFKEAKAGVEEQEKRIKLLRSYNKVERLLASAVEAAREARSRAVDKSRIISKAKSTIDLAKIELRGTSNSLEWVADSIPGSTYRDMKETLEALVDELKVAEQLVDSEDYTGAQATATSVLHRAYEIADMIREAT